MCVCVSGSGGGGASQGAGDLRIVWTVVAVGRGDQSASVWTVLVRVGGQVCQQTVLVCSSLDLFS